MLFYSHAENADESAKLMSTGYLCPQCLSKHCELPVECRACGLTLVSAPHLARSYHYLFPVEPFDEVAFDGNSSTCYGCQKVLTQRDKKVCIRECDLILDKYQGYSQISKYICFQVYICNKCNQTFCLDCEIFIHESLHTCPGCATNPDTYHRSSDRA